MTVSMFMSEETESGSCLSAQSDAVARAAEGTSLYLINAVEQTIDSLLWLAKATSGIADLSRITAAKIRESSPNVGEFLDPEDKIISSLQRSYNHFEGELPKLVIARASIDADTSLSGDQKELLHSAYHEALDDLANLVEAAKDLRAAIISHDLAAESRDVDGFNDVVTLIGSLRSAI